MPQLIKLKTLVLKSGAHNSPKEGMCVMEAVAYFANEPHSDAPKCACPVLSAYMRKLNDSFTESERQLLKPYIKRLIGTRDGNAQKRANILAWASIVKFTPHSLSLIGLDTHANQLKSLKKFDWSAAYIAASAARSAADSAARSAADSAAIAASAASAAYIAASAARSAADSAARSAADSAAYIAARSAARSAAYIATSAASAASAAYIAKNDKNEARLIVVKLALEALDDALKIKGDSNG